mmetsp:Transcript_3402/g.9761  ORF Transcript_3402/g.9761 Transcript_3402/m.9761 type:complete len:304 (+) Transcript_3402:271-1182(+)
MKATAVRSTVALSQGGSHAVTSSPSTRPRNVLVPGLCRQMRDGAWPLRQLALPRLARLAPLCAYSYDEEEVVIPKGTLDPSSILSVNRKIGEGSFGQVFEASMLVAGAETKVTMKKMKPKVDRCMEMGLVEISINSSAAQRARGSCAQYLGHLTVGRQDANPSAGLTEGLWLVWEYQGYKTLDSYLRQKDFMQRLSADLEVAEESVVPTVMKQIFEALKALHAGRIVHRDVKPMNLLFCEKDRTFRFIDLGACVDMKTAMNFDPERSIFDPVYCAPELARWPCLHFSLQFPPRATRLVLHALG